MHNPMANLGLKAALLLLKSPGGVSIKAVQHRTFDITQGYKPTLFLSTLPTRGGISLSPGMIAISNVDRAAIAQV